MSVPPTGWGKSAWRRRQLLTAARPTPARRAIPAAVTSVAPAPLAPPAPPDPSALPVLSVPPASPALPDPSALPALLDPRALPVLSAPPAPPASYVTCPVAPSPVAASPVLPPGRVGPLVPTGPPLVARSRVRHALVLAHRL
ncbi:hypothetical protein GCM10010245_61090 [Streptomyces spectabilis]|nr:hypothetical protein GCM10010245_61090 [Streptomyces spectabilis]